MRAKGVTDTIKLAPMASGCDQATVSHKPRLLSDNYSCYISGDLVAGGAKHEACPWCATPPADVYFGRDKAIIRKKESIKKRTITQRARASKAQAALMSHFI